MGGTVARTYVLSVVRPDDAPGTPRHVLGPGKFSEEAFRELDLVLKIANEQDVRLIIPFVDNWKWQGGRAEYAGFRGKDRDDFWTDPQLIADFKETIRFVLLRTNTLTGVRYCDDKAILCWKPAMNIPNTEWTREIARYIKSLDTNIWSWTVMPGNCSLNRLRYRRWTSSQHTIIRIRDEQLRLPSSSGRSGHGKRQKPYVVGEFGFVSTAEMEKAMQAIMDSGTSGGLLWSLRFRDRDGGFYWHSEPSAATNTRIPLARFNNHWGGVRPNESFGDDPSLCLCIRGLTPPRFQFLRRRITAIVDAGAISCKVP